MTHENIQETIKHFQISMIDEKNGVYKESQKIMKPYPFTENGKTFFLLLFLLVNYIWRKNISGVNVFYVCLLFELWYIGYFVRERRTRKFVFFKFNIFSMAHIWYQFCTEP